MNDPNLTTVEEMLFMDRLLDDLEKEGIDTSKLKNNAAFMNDPLNFDVNAFLKRSVVSGLEDSNHSVSAATAFAAGVGKNTYVENHGRGAKKSTLKSVFGFAARKTLELARKVCVASLSASQSIAASITAPMVASIRSISALNESRKGKSLVAASVIAGVIALTAMSGGGVNQNADAAKDKGFIDLFPYAAETVNFDKAIHAAIQDNFLAAQQERERVFETIQPVNNGADQGQVDREEVQAMIKAARTQVDKQVHNSEASRSITVDTVERSGVLITSISEGIKKSRNRHNNLEQSTISQFVGHLAITEAANEVMATNADPDNPQYERQQFENAVVAGLMTIEGLYKQEIAGGATERSAFNDSLEQLSYLTLSAAANDADMSTLGTSAAITLAKKNPEVIKDSNIDSAGMAKYLATEAAKSIEAQGKERMIRVALDGITDVAYSHAEDKSGINLDPEKAKLSAGGLYIGVYDLPSSLSPTDVSKVLSRVAERGVKNVPHSDPSAWSRVGTNAEILAADMKDKASNTASSIKAGAGSAYNATADVAGAAYDKTAEFASNAASSIKSGAAYNKTAEFASNTASSIKAGAGSAYNATADVAGTAFDATGKAFGATYAFFADKLSKSNPDQNAEVSTPKKDASAYRSM